MYRLILATVFIFSSMVGLGQALQMINYNYEYSPTEPFELQWDLLKVGDQFQLQFNLKVKDENTLKFFKIELEGRASLTEKTNIPVVAANTTFENEALAAGKIDFSTTAAYIILKVIRTDQNIGWFFHKPLSSARETYLMLDSKPYLNKYININEQYLINYPGENQNLIVSYYNEEFPAAAPPFSTAQASVSKLIDADSIFTINKSNSVRFEKKGIYLIQADTTSKEGFAVRAENDYPKYNTLSSLSGPLIYVCTKQEYNRILNAGNDKKKFDQVILSITGNAERAKNFMRSYFQHVEYANRYFTSYKEGWKTDRGMIYVVFGIPNSVYRFENREVWEYDNAVFKYSFTFIKSPTIFDPENYILVRDKKFNIFWYDTIDLWRKSRF